MSDRWLRNASRRAWTGGRARTCGKPRPPRGAREPEIVRDALRRYLRSDAESCYDLALRAGILGSGKLDRRDFPVYRISRGRRLRLIPGF